AAPRLDLFELLQGRLIRADLNFGEPVHPLVVLADRATPALVPAEQEPVSLGVPGRGEVAAALVAGLLQLQSEEVLELLNDVVTQLKASWVGVVLRLRVA